MKKLICLIKPVIIIIAVNALTYLCYLLLFALNVLHYYELEAASTKANLHVFIFDFVISSLFTLLLTSVVKMNKAEQKILLIGLVLTDLLSFNYSGIVSIFEILFTKNINDIAIKTIAFMISSGVLCIMSIIGTRLSKYSIKKQITD